MAVLPPNSRRDERIRLARNALDRWKDDPVQFAEDVLRVDDEYGFPQPVKCWSRQVELLRAIPKNKRVSVRSGHKCGKSMSVAIAALWWVCTRPKGRVILTSASYFQVEEVLWKQITQLYTEAAVPLGGELHELPSSGLQYKDGRQIIGLSVKEPTRIAGFSGRNLLFICDEASGIEDRVLEAIEGNRAGGAHMVMISNPTHLAGIFYESHTSKAQYWKTLHISSEEVARELPEGTGLAGAEYIEEKRREWGPDYLADPRYSVRILGQFPSQGTKAVVPLAFVDAATARWASAPPSHGAGTLHIGVDVARFGGDSSCIIWRRGRWASRPLVLKGEDVVEVAGRVLQVARENARSGEIPRVFVDSAVMGAGVADILRRNDAVQVQAISSSSASTASGFHRLRDQLWWGMREWLKDGGAISDDQLLRDDLVAPTYEFDPASRIIVEAKPKLRERIGRSTDRADALALSIFEGGEVNNTGAIFDAFENTPKTSWR